MEEKNQRGNLLIVDDEEMLTESIELLMQDHADKTYTAHNGEQALEVLKNENIHCIICDISMPGMNGVDVIKQARSNGYSRPFIFYTAYGSEELMMEAVKYEAFDFLDKPNLDGLEEVVTRGLEQGLHGSVTKPAPEAFMSEFKALLNQLEKK